MDNDLIPWEPDISREEMLTCLQRLLADSVTDIRLLREHQDRIRAELRKVQADPNWSTKRA